MNRVKVVGKYLYTEFFVNIGFQLIDTLEDADLIVFTGGTDIYPGLYGENTHPTTDEPDISRDIYEQELFIKATDLGIPKFGICRGAQFLCVMSGGKLYQHVENHERGHIMHTSEGDMSVTSSHHQMMRIDDVEDADLLGWSDSRSSVYYSDKGLETPPVQDPEVVYFRKTNSLAHQPHPEWMELTTPYIKWTIEQINQLVKGDL